MEINRNNLEWWIDFVEGEQAYDVKSNVESLLEHSQVHQLIVHNIKALKQTIYETKDDLLPVEDSYYANMKSEIMNKLESESILKKYKKNFNKFTATRLNLFL